MTAEVIENTISKERTPERIIQLKLNDAHICGNVECNTISNCIDVCPGCTSQTATVAALIDNPLNSLAHEIAEESSRADIESFTSWLQENDKPGRLRWYNLATELDAAQRYWVDRAAEYLEGAGKLIRNPENALLVRWEGCGE